jgi:hypothetical protein
VDLPDAPPDASGELSADDGHEDENALDTLDGPAEAEKSGGVRLEDLFNSDEEDDEFKFPGAAESSPNGKTEGSSPPPMYGADPVLPPCRRVS